MHMATQLKSRGLRLLNIYDMVYKFGKKALTHETETEIGPANSQGGSMIV